MSAPRRATALGVGLGALAVLVALTIAVRDRRTRAMDAQVRRWMRRHRTRRGRAAMSVVTLAGLPPAHLPAALICALIVGRKRGVAPAVPLALSSVVAFAAHHAIKAMLPSRRRPRDRFFERDQPAFPSGHTTGATAVSLTIGYILRRERMAPPVRVVPFAAGVPLMVGFSRAYLDRHWAADVMAGWLLGTGIAGLCVSVYEETRAVSEARSRLPRAPNPRAPSA